jgi:hypothetical protein
VFKGGFRGQAPAANRQAFSTNWQQRFFRDVPRFAVSVIRSLYHFAHSSTESEAGRPVVRPPPLTKSRTAEASATHNLANGLARVLRRRFEYLRVADRSPLAAASTISDIDNPLREPAIRGHVPFPEANPMIQQFCIPRMIGSESRSQLAIWSGQAVSLRTCYTQCIATRGQSHTLIEDSQQ